MDDIDFLILKEGNEMTTYISGVYSSLNTHTLESTLRDRATIMTPARFLYNDNV